MKTLGLNNKTNAVCYHIYLIVVFLMSTIVLSAQEQAQKQLVGIEGGLGWYSLSVGDVGIGTNLKLSIINNKDEFGILYNYAVDFKVLSDATESINYFGFSYGRRFSGDFLSIGLSGGVGVVFGEHKGEKIISSSWFSETYEKESYSTMGIHGEFDFLLQPVPFFGFGPKLFASANPENSNFGISLMLKVMLK